MTTKAAKKPKKPAARNPVPPAKKKSGAKPVKNLDPAQEERSRAKPRAIPPTSEDRVHEVFDRGAQLVANIKKTREDQERTKTTLKALSGQLEAQCDELEGLWEDARTGQLRLPLKTAAAAPPAGPAAGKAEAQAFDLEFGGHLLRVECKGPGEWAGTVTDKKGGLPRTTGSFRTAGQAQDKAVALVVGTGAMPVVEWKPGKLKEPGEDEPTDVVFVAFDGDLKLEAKQTSKGKWSVRDNKGRPLANDLPLARAQKAAAEEIGAKKLSWTRIAPDPALHTNAPAKAEAPAA